MIRKEAWPFYRTSSGVRLCWVSENQKDLKEGASQAPVAGREGGLSVSGPPQEMPGIGPPRDTYPRPSFLGRSSEAGLPQGCPETGLSVGGLRGSSASRMQRLVHVWVYVGVRPYARTGNLRHSLGDVRRAAVLVVTKVSPSLWAWHPQQA